MEKTSTKTGSLAKGTDAAAGGKEKTGAVEGGKKKKRPYVPPVIEVTNIRIELGVMTNSAALKPKTGQINEIWNAAEQEDGFQWDAYDE